MAASGAPGRPLDDRFGHVPARPLFGPTMTGSGVSWHSWGFTGTAWVGRLLLQANAGSRLFCRSHRSRRATALGATAVERRNRHGVRPSNGKASRRSPQESLSHWSGAGSRHYAAPSPGSC